MQLAIDAVDDDPVVALAGAGAIFATDAWHTDRNHSVELLPRIDALVSASQRTKGEIDAVFVDIGPGGYAALRVGVSIAKAVAHGLAAAIVGIGRLELDAWRVSGTAGGRRAVAVHRAGRGEIAWAAYRRDGRRWHEAAAPRMSASAAMLAELHEGDVVTGDVDAALGDDVRGRGARVTAPADARIAALVALGDARLRQGRTDDARGLVPLYLRAPAIGPQRPL